jgi:hypothetical protein
MRIAPSRAPQVLDVDKDADRVGVAFAPADLAIRAGHGAAVRRRGRDEIGGASVRAHLHPLFHPEHERVALCLQPVPGQRWIGTFQWLATSTSSAPGKRASTSRPRG